MKHLFIFLLCFSFSFSFSQSLEKDSSINSKNFDLEIASLSSSINILPAETKILEKQKLATIEIFYGAEIDLNKEITTKKYYEILRDMMESPTSIRELLQELRVVYYQKSLSEPDKLIKIPQVITIFACGGCGCVTPRKVGYASCTGNTCWCACCPKPK